MKPIQLLLTVSGFLALDQSPFARAQDTNTLEIIRQLQQRIDQLEQKVQALEREKAVRTSLATDRIERPTTSTTSGSPLTPDSGEPGGKRLPELSVGPQGASFTSADGDFAVRLRGVLQVDSRTFFGDKIVGNDGFLLRRARPILEGTLFRDFDFMFVPDFAGTGAPQIFDAYLNYRYNDAFQVQGGKFKSPVGLEQLVADRDLLFNERSLVTGLVPNRDLGFQVHGDLWGGMTHYAVGIFNGVGDGRNSNNADSEDDKALEGRLFFEPFKPLDLAGLKGFGLGLGGSYESTQATNNTGLPQTTGGTLPGYVTDGQQQFFSYNPVASGGRIPVVLASGDHWRLSPQAYYYRGPLGVLGEYAISDQEVTRTGVAPFRSASLAHKAWDVTGSWVLTGEDASFAGGVVPRNRFDPARGGWGALQLVARYGELRLDDATFPTFADPSSSARAAAAWSLGLNWYLNRNVLLKTSFSHTTFRGGGANGSDRKEEDALFTRVQLAF